MRQDMKDDNSALLPTNTKLAAYTVIVLEIFVLFFILFFKNLFIYFNWRLITLQCAAYIYM